MHKLKKSFVIIFLSVFILILVGTVGFYQINKRMKSYESFSFHGLNLSQIKDGTYTGSEDGGIVKATVAVTVENHVITKIKVLSHDCGKGKPAEAIVNSIVAKNSLEVDTISGATYSSNVLRAAVYQALALNKTQLNN